MKITESQLRQWLDAVTAGDMSLSRMAELINERQLCLSDSDFFSGLKEHFGIDIEKKDRMAFCVSASKEVSDLRWVLCMHPDQEMVTSSCLHHLGDEAQIWWRENKKRINSDY